MSINQRFKEVRTKYGYTQVQFAELLEVNQQSITDVETNKKKPSFQMLEKLGNKLGISMDWLICNSGHMKKMSYFNTASLEASDPPVNESKLLTEKMELLEENRKLRIRIEELEGKRGGVSEQVKPKAYK